MKKKILFERSHGGGEMVLVDLMCLRRNLKGKGDARENVSVLGEKGRSREEKKRTGLKKRAVRPMNIEKNQVLPQSLKKSREKGRNKKKGGNIGKERVPAQKRPDQGSATNHEEAELWNKKRVRQIKGFTQKQMHGGKLLFNCFDGTRNPRPRGQRSLSKRLFRRNGGGGDK